MENLTEEIRTACHESLSLIHARFLLMGFFFCFQSIQDMGNTKARRLYEANLPDSFRRPQTDQYPPQSLSPCRPRLSLRLCSLTWLSEPSNSSSGTNTRKRNTTARMAWIAAAYVPRPAAGPHASTRHHNPDPGFGSNRFSCSIPNLTSVSDSLRNETCWNCNRHCDAFRVT